MKYEVNAPYLKIIGVVNLVIDIDTSRQTGATVEVEDNAMKFEETERRATLSVSSKEQPVSLGAPGRSVSAHNISNSTIVTGDNNTVAGNITQKRVDVHITMAPTMALVADSIEIN